MIRAPTLLEPTLSALSESKRLLDFFQRLGERFDRKTPQHSMCWRVRCVGVRFAGADISSRTERHDARPGRKKAIAIPIAWLGLEHSECETGAGCRIGVAARGSRPGASICRARVPGCAERSTAVVPARLRRPPEWKDPGIDGCVSPRLGPEPQIARRALRARSDRQRRRQ